MKLKSLFAVILLVTLLCTVSPVHAQETQGSGETTVGYQTSTTVEIPSGGKENGKGNIKTGDSADLRRGLVLFGLSGSFLIFLFAREHEEKARGTSSVEVKKQTWKNMKILGTLACVGVLGMGVIGNSVMAAESTGNTNVFYASNSTQMLL